MNNHAVKKHQANAVIPHNSKALRKNVKNWKIIQIICCTIQA